MIETYKIRDMEIMFQYTTCWELLVHLSDIGKFYHLVDRTNAFITMCRYMDASYHSNHVYREILIKIIDSGKMEHKELIMYKNYFSDNDWYEKSIIEHSQNLNRQKTKTYEMYDDYYDYVTEHNTSSILPRVSITTAKLGNSFWGNLILKDIIK
jgi:hypothetical protein